MALTVKNIIDGFATKQFSSREITQDYLTRINKINPQINAFISVCEQHALEQAEQADKLLAEGADNGLTGVPIVHKDLFCTKGIRTSCGSRMLDNFISPYDATVVEKLNKAGTVTLGKTNMDEFAMGSTTENSYYGATKNPWDLNAVPGGSSGGSAAAVAAQLTPAATASDTGGSIRQPASFCGITGIKPTYGRVSRYGMVAYASSLDQGGVMAQTAEDCAIILEQMSGLDNKDSTSVDKVIPPFSKDLMMESSKPMKIGIPEEWMTSDLNAEIKQAIDTALKQFESMGAIIESVSLPNTKYSIPAYYIIATSEASANLSRFDGVRYGHRCDNPQSLDDLYCRSRSEGFGSDTKNRIMLGTYSLSAGYYDDYYIKAQKLRRLISNDYASIFADFDFIMGPVTTSTAFDLGELQDPVEMYMSDVYTLSLNLTGRPGLSIPVGIDSRNRPIGMQIIADYWSESSLFQAAHQYQLATDWHKKEAPFDG